MKFIEINITTEEVYHNNVTGIDIIINLNSNENKIFNIKIKPYVKLRNNFYITHYYKDREETHSLYFPTSGFEKDETSLLLFIIDSLTKIQSEFGYFNEDYNQMNKLLIVLNQMLNHEVKNKTNLSKSVHHIMKHPYTDISIMAKYNSEMKYYIEAIHKLTLNKVGLFDSIVEDVFVSHNERKLELEEKYKKELSYDDIYNIVESFEQNIYVEILDTLMASNQIEEKNKEKIIKELLLAL